MDAGVLHIPENSSDHCPIYCIVDVELVTVEKAVKDSNKLSEKPSWKKATEAKKVEFTRILDEELSYIESPHSLHCTDVMCTNADHCNDADNFIAKILDTVEQVAAGTLPSSYPPRCCRKPPVAGWNDVVKPFHEKAYF